MVIVYRKYNVQISGMLVHIKLKKSKEMNVLVVIIIKFADTRRLRDGRELEENEKRNLRE